MSSPDRQTQPSHTDEIVIDLEGARKQLLSKSNESFSVAKLIDIVATVIIATGIVMLLQLCNVKQENLCSAQTHNSHTEQRLL